MIFLYISFSHCFFFSPARLLFLCFSPPRDTRLWVILAFFRGYWELCNLASSCGGSMPSQHLSIGFKSHSLFGQVRPPPILLLPSTWCLHENSIKIVRNGSGRGVCCGSNTEVVRSLPESQRIPVKTLEPVSRK